ncbi:MAG: Ig domain-containing protein, partial [Clostridia bacterium]|nr:Ig domain-containing protein [Clostridia bacterium]
MLKTKRMRKRILSGFLCALVILMNVLPVSVWGVEVDDSSGTAYKLADSLADGKEYLIVSAADGSGYALTNPGGTSGGANMGSTGVTIERGDVDADGVEDAYILTEETSIVWTATANGSRFNLTNGSDYLEGKSGKVAIFSSQQYADRGWTYSGSQLQHAGGNNTYTVYYSSGFTSSYSSTSEKVYLFEKTEIESGTADVTGVTLDRSELTLSVGKTGVLKATVTPSNAANKTVVWSSSSETVATVSADGVVTAVAEGSATITATTADGGFTATCAVTVTGIEGTAYKLADSLADGKEYLIVSAADGSGYALTNPGGTSGGAN